MKKRNTILLGLALTIAGYQSSRAQQWVIANKDNTHPEINNAFYNPAFIQGFTAQHFNGYNEIKWSSMQDQDTRKFIVEYSLDGINFQSAGEALVSNTHDYLLKHYTTSESPMIYRVRGDMLNGRQVYTNLVVLSGIPKAPVSFYPTVVTGNTINVNADWPVERMVITSTNGGQVFVKEMGGKAEHIPVVIPSLGKGIYFITFYGKGWQTTEKMVVG